MLIVEPKELQFSTKQETPNQLLQEEITIHSPVNNCNYYPYEGA